MLSFFKIKKTFQSTVVSLSVDCEGKAAGIAVSHNQIICLRAFSPDGLKFEEVATPALAEEWLSQQRPVPGTDGTLSLVEFWNHCIPRDLVQDTPCFLPTAAAEDELPAHAAPATA